jgi:hypothetical protein
MSILSKITGWWSDLMDWMSNPIGRFEKVRHSPLTFILMLFFFVQPVISLYTSTAQSIGWIHHSFNPQLNKNSQKIEDLEKRVDALEHKKPL